MKRLTVLLILLLVTGTALAEVPALPAGEPGSWFDWPASTCLANPFIQYQPGPDPCYVCGPFPGWTPTEEGEQVPGSQTCADGDETWYYVSCTCPATGGGTIGGRRERVFECSEGVWYYDGDGVCRTGGSPSYCP